MDRPLRHVRIVRTLTPQILDWKGRISEKGELGRTAGCRAELETEAIGTGPCQIASALSTIGHSCAFWAVRNDGERSVCFP